MKNIAGIILLLFSVSSMAAKWTDGKQELKSLIWKPGAEGFYVTPTTFNDPEGCGGSGNMYLVDNTLGEKEKDRLLSLIMVAYTSGDKIHVWVDDCNGTNPKFTGLQLNK